MHSDSARPDVYGELCSPETPDGRSVLRIASSIPFSRQQKSDKHVKTLFAKVNKTVASENDTLKNPFWGPYPHVMRSRFSATPSGDPLQVPLQVDVRQNRSRAWMAKDEATLRDELFELVVKSSTRDHREIYRHIRDGHPGKLSDVAAATLRAQSRVHKLSTLHAAVLFAPAAQRDDTVRVLLAKEVADTPDSHGATATMRARQLGVSFDGHEVRSALPNVSLFTRDGIEIRYTSEEQFAEALYRHYPERERDLRYRAAGCDPDFIYYSYVYGPDHPQVGLANRFSLDRMRLGYGNIFPQRQSVRVDTRDLPRVCVCPHPDGAVGLGAYAGQDVEAGRIVFVATSRLHQPEFVGMGVGLKAHVASDYAMFVSSNPNLEELSLFPEMAVEPWLFTNDAMDDGLYNIAPAPLFINGLPAAVFFSLKRIEKGEELFWCYLQGGYDERQARSGVRPVVLAQRKHPMLVGA